MSVFELSQANSPLVISVPHDGALIPESIMATMNPQVVGSSDRDYQIAEVFKLAGISCSKITANYSRHVIDLNRPASGEALYANQTETELCPTSTFDFQAIYQPGSEPDQQEIQRRINRYWQPYHQQLTALVQAAKARHGFCLLIDAHSIDDEVPRFFQGRLPDINVGTHSGKSCAPELEQKLLDLLGDQHEFSHIANGRFKGGFITRHYGHPERGIHAIQLEHAKSSYLDQDQIWSGRGDNLRKFWQHALPILLAVHKS